MALRRRTAPDLAIVGADVRTLDPARPHATAVAVRHGRIVLVGDDAEVRAACDAKTLVEDGRGVALVPGLTDAHLHPVWGAELTAGADLRGLRSVDAVRAALAAEQARTGAGADGWVHGWGLEHEAFAGTPLSGAALADALDGAPALVLLTDLHTAVATPRALELAGIDGPHAFPDGSEVVCVDGAPTGELREPGAYDLVLAVAPAPTEDEHRRRVAEVLRRLNAVGLTGGHAMDGDASTPVLLAGLEAAGALTVRLVAPVWVKPEMGDEEVDALLALRDEGGHRWRMGVAKFFIDGVVETGTAWLEEPDALGGGRHPHWPDPARYAEVVGRAAAAGHQCVTHAIGDRAVRAALDAYSGAARATAPHRIEHLEVLGDAELARLAPEGVVASMQPLHMQWGAGEGDAPDAFALRLGPERSARAFRTRDVLASGATLALGSDWPVAGFDPREGMAWARLRRPPGAPDVRAQQPGQALTGLEALAGYTTGAARAVGEAADRGRIAPGFRGDLTGFAADPVDCPPDDLVDLPVRLTVVDGDVVHRRAA